MAKDKQTRAGISCANCDRFLVTEGHAGLHPRADTPPEKIHYIDHPTLKGASFMCSTCGHYTLTKDTRGDHVIQ